MMPYYIQKHSEITDSKSNRKSALCPQCGREELIGIDNELIKCSICVQIVSSQEQETSVKGEDIKSLREKLGVSLKSFADDMKISKGVLSDIENNKRRVNDTLIKWYRAHISLNAQNSPLNTRADKDISTYQPPLF